MARRSTAARMFELIAEYPTRGEGALRNALRFAAEFIEVAEDRRSALEAQLERERLQHAACLTIAEGGCGWKQPTAFESPAIKAVRELRQEVEERRAFAEKRMKGKKMGEILKDWPRRGRKGGKRR